MIATIDIIILSFAKNEELRSLTEQTIQTVLDSEDPSIINFNVLVIESNKDAKPYEFTNTRTIYPRTKFGFNKYLNIGINETHNNYICLCNNDLIFHKGWAKQLIDVIDKYPKDAVVLSPFCDYSHSNFLDLTEPTEGYFGYFAGYCFFTARQTIQKLGPLDENINFWYADRDFINLMHQTNTAHYLVPTAKVSHLVSRVTAEFSKLDTLRYTYYPRIYFRYKWEDKNVFLYAKRLFIYRVKYALCLLRGS